MSDADVFGPLVLTSDIEARAQTVLEEFIEPYLGWVERKTGRDKGALPRPRMTAPRGEPDEWPEDVPPVLIPISTGTVDEPEELDDGYHAVYALGIVCVVEAKDEASVRKLAAAYAGAIMACLLHKPLGGPVDRVWLAGLDTGALFPSEKRRSLGAAQVEFRVAVSPVVSTDLLGPAEVDEDDPRGEYPDAPTVETVEFDGSAGEWSYEDFTS